MRTLWAKAHMLCIRASNVAISMQVIFAEMRKKFRQF